MSKPSDSEEQEADRIADAFAAHRASGRREPTEARNAHGPTREGSVASESGDPLAPSVRREYETFFAADLSQVRVHTGPAAQAWAQALNAEAFTIGDDLYFAPAKFAPESNGGQKLLAHEIAHAVRSPGSEKVLRKPATPTEAELATDIEATRALIESYGEPSESIVELERAKEKLAWMEAMVSESDPAAREAIFHRAMIRELKSSLASAADDAARAAVRTNIYEHERALMSALEQRELSIEAELTALLDRYAAAAVDDPQLEAEIAAREIDLLEVRAELAILHRTFPPETGPKLKKKYIADVRPMKPMGGCMNAVYEGLGVLYSPAESKEISREVYKKTTEKTRSVDRILETLVAHGRAAEKITLTYNRKAGRWEPGAEETIRRLVPPDYPGWYFFGMSVSGGYHSVILAVENPGDGPVRIYWMDQYYYSSKKNVTGKLDAELKDYEPSYGYTDVRLWPLLAP